MDRNILLANSVDPVQTAWIHRLIWVYTGSMSWGLSEPPHDKTNKMACAPSKNSRSAWASTQSDQSWVSAWRKLGSLATHWVQSKDSDQSGHPVWSVFAVSMKKAKVLSYPMSAQLRRRCPGWSESSLDKHPFCWFCHEGAHFYLERLIVVLTKAHWNTPHRHENPQNILISSYIVHPVILYI